MTKASIWGLALGPLLLLSVSACGPRSTKARHQTFGERFSQLYACVDAIVHDRIPHIASERQQRFIGKVSDDLAACRGGMAAVKARRSPWVQWSRYNATADERSMIAGLAASIQNERGIIGSIMDLELQRMELIKFNLFDNSGTYETFAKRGPTLSSWPEMRLPPGHPNYAAVGGQAEHQLCTAELVRFRTVTGICNDVRNPLMGSTGQPFARNVQFEAAFPDLSDSELAKNRHAARIGLLVPDPQVISRTLFTRAQSDPGRCAAGAGSADAPGTGRCDYKKAPFLNVLAAFWIQFMTHDWFSHLEDGHNQPSMMSMGCASHKVDGREQPLSAEQAQALGCRPDDSVGRALIAKDMPAPTFTYAGKTQLARAPKVTNNNVTAWWDASQLYGYDERSRTRVKRDPNDPAQLRLEPTKAEQRGYLPLFGPDDAIYAAWAGQEATAFADNWNIGLSFYHNLFAREHNSFVQGFRRRANAHPSADSGLRRPAQPQQPVPYKAVTHDELFEVARLVVAAEIAKIHTVEWTTQLLYDKPLALAMRSNWHGFLNAQRGLARAFEKLVLRFGGSEHSLLRNAYYSAFASGPGIFGLGSHIEGWSISNPQQLNGGVNHFGSPFNFPEEFTTVYRLHPLVPDMIELRNWQKNPNAIVQTVPVLDTFRARGTQQMHERGIANWGLSMGRQRLGALTLHNHPLFLQNLPMPHLHSTTGKLDVAALDIVRDRERGIPRFNEFRRQIGLQSLTSFDDFLGEPAPDTGRAEREQLVAQLRELYGQHTCDASKVTSDAQVDERGAHITDCLGHPNGTLVDNVEDLDTLVGWLAEPVRPHGFAISETQFQIFILNASRRLFSDRFFTSSFRPEIYTQLGVDWVNDNGPDKQSERARSAGDPEEVSPLKRVLLRNIPELAPELAHVVNAFDPWARDRGNYYLLDWKPRKGAETDVAFKD